MRCRMWQRNGVYETLNTTCKSTISFSVVSHKTGMFIVWFGVGTRFRNECLFVFSKCRCLVLIWTLRWIFIPTSAFRMTSLNVVKTNRSSIRKSARTRLEGSDYSSLIFGSLAHFLSLFLLQQSAFYRIKYEQILIIHQIIKCCKVTLIPWRQTIRNCHSHFATVNGNF